MVCVYHYGNTVDRNWNVFPCKQVPFLRHNHLNIENFKPMNIIAVERITAFSSLGVAVLVSKCFLLKACGEKSLF